MTSGAARAPLLALLGALACAGPPAAAIAQGRDTAVAAGERYRAGGLQRMLLGGNYRSLWRVPVRVEVLDPDTFAGGLTLLREGGGLSTESLRLRGADGREYVFRSVDKDVTPSLHEDLRGTLPGAVAQDYVSAKHPAAALVLPPLLEAVGVLHAVPRMAVMPDHAFLDELRERFRGRLGQIELRPTAGDGPHFAGAEDVEGTDDFLELLEDDPRNRVDARGYLTARLMDLVVGDWDRHLDQWRWARFDSGGVRLWRPIPRDRDNALVRHEGLVASLGRRVLPTMTRFGPDYGDLFGLVIHASGLDRRLLPGLERPAWDSVAAFVQARLTDRVIDAAVASLPPEYREAGGAGLAHALRVRRDLLPEAARHYYALLSSEVDVRATDRDDAAEVERYADGSVEVRITASEGGAPYFRRRFLPGETREVRVFLHGGEDRAVVAGEGPGRILVRLIGGGGDDALADRSRVPRGRTVLYDARGDNRLEPGAGARVDERPYQAPGGGGLVGNAPPPRDWGAEFSVVAPWAGWEPNVGPVLGAGPAWTRYGFRRHPHATRLHARAVWAPLRGGFGVDVAGERRWTNSPHRTVLRARAGNFAVARFHGFGNRSPGQEIEDELFTVEQVQVRVEPAVVLRLHPSLELRAGPSLAWTDAEDEWFAAIPPRLQGFEPFAQAGAATGAVWDRRSAVTFPRSGFRLSAGARGYGWTDGAPFGSAEGEARAYLSLPGPAGPTLALRGGGVAAFGDFPFQEAAFIGGVPTLRGYPHHRFAGDAGVYGGGELRARLARVNLGLVGGRLGALVLADAGRVYVDGASPGGWHTAVGGGLFLETLERVVTLTYADGDRGRLYLQLGVPF